LLIFCLIFAPRGASTINRLHSTLRGQGNAWSASFPARNWVSSQYDTVCIPLQSPSRQLRGGKDAVKKSRNFGHWEIRCSMNIGKIGSTVGCGEVLIEAWVLTSGSALRTEVGWKGEDAE
jgi:hypothetical protein